MSEARRYSFAAARSNPFGAGSPAQETHHTVTYADAVRRTRWIAVDINADRFTLLMRAPEAQRHTLVPCFDSDYPLASARMRGVIAQMGDTLAQHAAGSTVPLWWATSEDQAEMFSRLGWTVKVDVARANIAISPGPNSGTSGSGVAFPVFSDRGPSGLVVFSGPAISLEADGLFETHARCFALFEAVTRIAAAEKDAAPTVSKREIECLRLAADGHTSEAIATLLGLSVHTANQYLTNTSQKLNAVNRMHAIAKALRLGLIE